MVEEYFVVVVTIVDYDFHGGTSTIEKASYHKFYEYPTKNIIKTEMERWDMVIDGRRAMKPLHARVEKRYSYKGE